MAAEQTPRKWKKKSPTIISSAARGSPLSDIMLVNYHNAKRPRSTALSQKDFSAGDSASSHPTGSSGVGVVGVCASAKCGSAGCGSGRRTSTRH